MKNYRFPSRASRIRDSRTSSLFSKLNSSRTALIVALIAGLSCVPFYVRAQNDAAPVKKVGPSSDYKPFANGGTFIVSQGPDGESVCRQATIDEARALSAGSVNEELHQINHLEKTEAGTYAPQSSTSATGLTIVLRATAQLEANTTAKNAFIAAAAKWETLIKDPITVNVDVDFGTTFFGTPYNDPLILGATQAQLLYSNGNYPDLRQRLINHATGSESSVYNALPASSVPTDIGSVSNVLIASPLMRALGLLNPVADDSEQSQIGPTPKIGFNSAFNFDFNPNDGISSNLTDFDAVAVHEMGHLLGFNSLVGDRELDPTDPLALTVWDLFRFRPGTANLNNFGTAQRILSSGGAQVQFNGGPELGLSTGKPDGSGGDGNQASHWKDDQNNPANFIGIMDPNIARGKREVMTDNDTNAIDSFGYTLIATAAPPNDNFTSAIVLTGATGTVNGTNAGATKETGEPIQPVTNPPRTGGRSVWYNWTATGNGQATFDTNGSNFDTTLAIYTGTAVNGLTLIAANDDISPISDPPPRNIQSLLTFSATAGTIYRIQVDGFNTTDVGDITLHWSGPAAATPTPTPTPGPNTVQFTSTTAGATETLNATTHVDLLVTRTGTTNQAATVDYATSDATANQRSDYEAAFGTLHFAGGETQKTITVFIVDDRYAESAETFNVTLSNPASCTLGSPVAVTVTIDSSNDPVNGTNPVKDASFNNDFFVRQHYLDFFTREPDAGGLAFWKGQLSECDNVPLPGGFTDAQQCREIRRINVSAAFFKSIEFQETGYLVERLYKSAYGNATGTSTLGGTHTLPVPIVRLNEFLGDTQQIGRGVIIGNPGADLLLESNKQALIAEFVLRQRFLTAFPLSMTPTQFVTALNTNAGGVLSTAEFNQLVSDLTTGAKTRAQVLRAVAEDPDLFAGESNRAFVLAQFFGYLRRNPNDPPETGLDYTGYDFWLGKLNQFNGNFVNAEMVKAFILSGEYQVRFGP